MKILSGFVVFLALFAFVPFSSVYAQEKVSEESMEKEMSASDVDEAGDKKESSMKKAPKYAHNKKKEKEKPLTLEEAQDLINSLPTAKDAIGGTVKIESSWQKYYDFYGRQIAYRERVKELRASLEARRVSFEEPRTPVIERYRETLEKVYAAETAAYQEDVSQSGKPVTKKRKKRKSKNNYPTKEDVRKAKEAKKDKNSTSAPEVEDERMAAVDSDVRDDDVGLKEQDVPAQEGDEDVKKKVVTSEDAPEFDPSNL
ncbi:MAG: hypothetical protein ACRBDL_10390 [Alphaproteobacteria bacterium]